jgi:E1A/CREB-binding protein
MDAAAKPEGGAPAAPAVQASSGRTLNGGWQSDKDVAARRKMIAKIVALLQQRKPNAPEEWLKKLPQMAKRLEEVRSDEAGAKRQQHIAHHYN